MLASINNNTKIAALLLNNNARINKRDKNGMSALMHAADAGNVKSFNQLLKFKANFKFKNKKKKTLIDIAQEKNRLSIISSIIKSNIIQISNTKLKQLLFSAVSNGNLQTIKMIDKKGIKLNVIDKSGNTLLMLSSSKGFYNTSKFLIKRKININTKNKHGNTALILAAQTGKYKIVELLLKSKADTSIRNKNRKTALDIAKSNGYRKTAKAISAADGSGNFLGLF